VEIAGGRTDPERTMARCITRRLRVPAVGPGSPPGL